MPEKQTYALKQQRVGQGLGGARVVQNVENDQTSRNWFRFS